MIWRVFITQCLLLVIAAVAHQRFGPFDWLSGGMGSTVLAAGILVYGVSLIFMAWKFELQPRLHGFQFNRSQRADVVARQLAGVTTFYDTGGAGFSWVTPFEARAPEIIREVRDLLATQAESDGTVFKTAYDNAVLSLSPTWKSLNLLSYGTVNSDLLPRTRAILGDVPEVFNCNLSKLGPHSDVKAHAGESTSYVRCHLGVIVPAEAPTTALLVGGESVSWAEGRVLAFCDGHWHAAHNHSDEDRYVLIFDVMPERLSWYTKQFCSVMVAFNVTQYLLPGRLNLDEPMWRPGIVLGNIGLATVGIPLFAGFYLYFQYFCSRRPAWVSRLSGAGFGFYY